MGIYKNMINNISHYLSEIAERLWTDRERIYL